MRWKANSPSATLQCSFCRKSQDEVLKLIASPQDDLRTYICDECVSVCADIIEDDQQPEPSDESAPANEPHPLLNHPLASELMDSLEIWIRQESLGHSAATELTRLRDLASRMMQVR
jgi:hypothetical protein